MTNTAGSLTRFSVLVVLLSSMGVTGCMKEETADYCRNHYLVHAEHQDDIGMLAVSIGADGVLASELTLPVTYMAEEIAEQIRNPDSVYTLQTERSCTPATSEVQLLEGGIKANYESRCGVDNKIGQLDVALFDTLSTVEELEVRVVTPVTQKHFAISRQCKSAIFRLEQRQ